LKRPPPERHDPSGVILPDHFRQGDSGISETPQHVPVELEHLLLAAPSAQFLRDFAMEFPVYEGSANSGSFHK
jgi:hypothetical protein